MIVSRSSMLRRLSIGVRGVAVRERGQGIAQRFRLKDVQVPEILNLGTVSMGRTADYKKATTHKIEVHDLGGETRRGDVHTTGHRLGMRR